MAIVGLLYVGAVLFINGLLLLGAGRPQSGRAVFNLFVGALQVITPTYLIFTVDGDPAVILARRASTSSASPTCTWGSACWPGSTPPASGTSRCSWPSWRWATRVANFQLLNDPPFGVIWLYWAFLWSCSSCCSA